MEIKINREIRNYTESMFFGLSMRQFIFSLLAVVVAVGLYFLLKPYVGMETVSWMCILGAAPFAALGFVSYHGMTAEQFIWAWLRSEMLEPRQLRFEASNIYYEALKDSIKARDMMRKGHDFRDYICPDSIEHHKDYLVLGKKFARVIYLKDYASYIKDDFVAELMDRSRSMMLSVDIIPIPTDEAVREVESRLLGVETNITNWQRRQNANNNFSAVVPYDMELQRKEAKEFLSDLTTRDQRMMFAVITIVHLSDSLEQLDSDTDSILSFAKRRMCQMAPMTFQQTDALNTVLPIGTRKINALRTLTTESLAAFIPFKAQEIQEPGGIYFGENAISHNLILCNMANLLNQSMFLLGIPGSGKSFFAKLLIIFLALSTKEDIIICDPEGEYSPLVKALGGSVVRIAAGGKDRVNAMDMVEGYGDNNPIVEKSQFIMSLIEQIDKNGVGAHQKSLIDRCVAEVYRDQKQTGVVPTLCTLREKLLEQPEQEARDLALALELFTSGSLDIFAHPTNVDTSNRIISYDIHDLGAQLKPAGLLTITDAMLNRVTVNWKKGKRTHLFVDEFHIVYENEYSGNFFTSAWRQFRKRNAYPCAITQNVEYLLDSVQASTMLSNSEFIVMLNQAASDREKLSQLLNISPEQMSYVTGADAGCGLMRYGNSLVPFINRFPRNTELYKLITTRPGEGIFGEETEEQPAPAKEPAKKPAQRKTPARKTAAKASAADGTAAAAKKTATRKTAKKKDADNGGGTL